MAHASSEVLGDESVGCVVDSAVVRAGGQPFPTQVRSGEEESKVRPTRNDTVTVL